MFNKLLLTSAICAAFIIPVGVEAVQAEVDSSIKSPKLIAQVLHPLQILSLTVNPVNELPPGTELIFTMEATPNATATLNIGNAVQNLPMEEVEFGIYQGRYIVQSGVAIRTNAVVKATLQRGYQSVGKVLEQPLVNEIVTEASYGNDPIAQSLAIERFTLYPVPSFAPGTKLSFTLTGTPGARAAFSIKGIGYNFPMQEISSGYYQGQYVVQQQDTLPTSEEDIIAHLQANNQLVQTTLSEPLSASSPTGNQVLQSASDQNLSTTASFSTETASVRGQVPIEILSPQTNSQVSSMVEVRGRSLPNTALNVSVQVFTPLAGEVGVNRNILSRRITTDAEGNFSFEFNPPPSEPGTRYEVNLNAATNVRQANQKTLVLFHQ